MQFARTTLTDPKAIIDLANRLERYPKIGHDTESAGPSLIHKTGKDESLNLYRSFLVGMSIAVPGEWPESYYIPISHKKPNSNAPLPAVAKLMEALADYRKPIAQHNAKHELYSMHTGPIPFRGFYTMPHCTQVLAWLLQMGWIDKKGDMRYGLDGLAKHYFGIVPATFREVTGGLGFDQLDPASPEARNYACLDAELALRFHDRLFPLLKDYDLEDEYLNTELPLIRVLRHMEDAGMALDDEEHGRVIEDLTAQRNAVQEQWNSMFSSIGINSAKQLQYFYEHGYWNTKGVPKSSFGYSTEAEYVQRQLEQLSPDKVGYKAAKLKLEFSKLNKLITTYGYAMAEKAWQYPDFRLHCSYNQTGTATGRFSANYPNLMQIPTRTPEGRRIRDAFVPAEGWKLCSADYSQIELRILAHYSGKGILYEGYREGTDVHAATAAALYGVPIEEVTAEQRANGKTTNFLIVYGGGPEKLARKVGLKSKEEGKEFLDRFKAVNPEAIRTLQRAVKAAEKRGYVRMLSGRFRRVDIPSARARVERLKAEGHRWSSSQEYREAWLELGARERQAGNAPIQGSARDIIVRAMLKLFDQMDHKRCKIVGQVHDDLLTEMTEDYVEEGAQLKREIMENAWLTLKVPLVVEPKWGDRWSEL